MSEAVVDKKLLTTGLVHIVRGSYTAILQRLNNNVKHERHVIFRNVQQRNRCNNLSLFEITRGKGSATSFWNGRDLRNKVVDTRSVLIEPLLGLDQVRVAVGESTTHILDSLQLSWMSWE
jgi:hypothetical protein